MSFNISARVNNLAASTRNISNDLTDTQAEVALIFSDYVTNEALSSSLANYATVADANASFALKIEYHKC